MRFLFYISLFLFTIFINGQSDSIFKSNDSVRNLFQQTSKPLKNKRMIYSTSLIDSFTNINNEKSAELFITNNFDNDQGLVIKWITNSIYREDGFDLYRREEGTDWVKLNSIPINLIRKSGKDENLDSEQQGLYDFTLQSSYNDFQTSLPRVFVLIKSIYSNYMANLIGIIYYDKIAREGLSYQYKLVGAGSNFELAISKKHTCSSYTKSPPPDSIKIERFKKRCDISWKPEIFRYYGVDIYRKTNDSTFRKITKTPRAIQKSKDRKGNISFPKVFYVDENINKEFNYTYKFIALDYFGKESFESEEIFIAKKDFDPPLKPFNLVPVKHDSKMTVDLSWDYVLEEDLLGFNIYRSNILEGPYKKINLKTIPKTVSFFNDRVTNTGDYYYYCSSVDFSGNESYSGKIYLQIHDMLPPDSPKNLQSETGPGFINLSWDNNLESDLKGYFIQRSLNDEDNSDNHFININSQPTIENSFSEKLSKNIRNKFVYRVIAVDTSFNRSKPSINSLAQMPDVTPPNHPIIKNVEFKDGIIVISWMPNIENDLEGYNLFRKLKSDSSSFIKVNSQTIPKDITIYRDRQTSSETEYLYILKAIDVNGNISEPSKPFFGYNPIEKLTSKIILTSELKQRKKRVLLNWNLENNEIEVQGSVIYRSTNENILKPYSKLINENSYIDDINPGLYNYQVRTYTNDGIVIMSEVIKIELLKAE